MEKYFERNCVHKGKQIAQQLENTKTVTSPKRIKSKETNSVLSNGALVRDAANIIKHQIKLDYQ